MPKFSVIMPTYNHSKFIGKAIKSVIGQSERDFELIIINNFSTDNTLKIIKKFKDSRIKVVNFNNLGIIASSRNEGIKISRGQYIAFLDSDDFWFSNKLEISLKFINQGHNFICHKITNKIVKKKKNNFLLKPITTLTIRDILLKGNVISTSSVVIKKSILKKVNSFCCSSKIVTAEDFHLWLKVLSIGYKCHMIQTILGYNRLHEKNVSQNLHISLKASIRVLIKSKFKIKKNIQDDKKIFKKSLGALYYSYGFKGLKKGDFYFLDFLKKALKYNSFNLKYYLIYFYYISKRRINVFYC